MITGSRYVIAVKDLERSIRYYTEVLGFTPHRLGDTGWCFLRREAAFIMAGQCPDAGEAGSLGDHSYFAYLELSDIDAYHARVTAAGAEIVKPLCDEPWGQREFALRTVDGHRIMFGQALDAEGA